jgi:RNA polymerase-binding transcription factor DksA
MDAVLQACEASFIDQVCLALVQFKEEGSTNHAEALAQLEAGTYGYCLDCLVEISAERLTAVTFAVRCADCEEARRIARR